jgi:hypothetical protein
MRRRHLHKKPQSVPENEGFFGIEDEEADSTNFTEIGLEGLRSLRRGNLSFDNMDRNELEGLLLRLCENEVSYKELKNMCSDNDLNGKDMLFKLRAKAIRRIRIMLGKPVWDKNDYGRNFKLPNEMSDEELIGFLEERQIFPPVLETRRRLTDEEGKKSYDLDMMPGMLDREEAVAFVFAIMAVDAVIRDEDIPSASMYDKMTSKQLADICRARNLLSSGNKAELMVRLQQHDKQQEERLLEEKAKSAAEEELATASVLVPPRPPNRELANLLSDAQATLAAGTRMNLLQLRNALVARGLPVYGTREVLLQRLTEIVRRDVIAAHAGKSRLLQYAEAAVSRLQPNEVMEALAIRGQPTFAGLEEATSRLANCLADEWIHDAMYNFTGLNEDLDVDDLYADVGFDNEPSSSQLEDLEELEGIGHAPASAVPLTSDETIGQEQGDPTIDVILLCSGDTLEQREGALIAARNILPVLQSDQLWGTHASGMYPSGFPELPEESDAPTETVEILALNVCELGALVEVSIPLAVTASPMSSIVKVTVKPRDGPVVTATGLGNQILLQNLRPSTQYAVTACLTNKSGDGPQSEMVLYNTLGRQGIAIKVLYAVAPLLAQRLTQESENENENETESMSGESGAYIQLNWEQLYGMTAAEIDARWNAGGFVGASLHEAVSSHLLADQSSFDVRSVVLPVGPSCDSATRQALAQLNTTPDRVVKASSWSTNRIQDLVASQAEFCAQAKALGFATVPLLRLSPSSVFLSENESIGAEFADATSMVVKEWLQEEGYDPETTRVALRVEKKGIPLAIGIGRGVEEILKGAADIVRNISQNFGIDNDMDLVLEALPSKAVCFTIAVFRSPGAAPVALVPTEIGFEDLEEDILASDLSVEKFYAIQEGEDEHELNKMEQLVKEGESIHPVTFGTAASATQRIVHSTPPKSIPVQVSERIRLAAARLFDDLGLEDFAQFTGWVVPEESGFTGDEGEQMANDAPLEINHDTRPRSFSALQSEFEEEQAEYARRAGVHVVSAEEKAGALDIGNAERNLTKLDGSSSTDSTPGATASSEDSVLFHGIAMDGRTREDLHVERAAFMEERYPTEHLPKVPLEVTIPTSLPDLGAINAKDVSRVGSDIIRFSQLSISPELADTTAPLSQAAALVGISPGMLPRLIVSFASLRLGMPPLPLSRPGALEAAAAGVEDIDELRKAGKTIIELFEVEGPSMEEIGEALESWSQSDDQVGLPDSYDDIASGQLYAAGEEGQDAMFRGNVDFDVDNDNEVRGGLWRDYDTEEGMGEFDAGQELLDGGEPTGLGRVENFPGLHPTRQRVWILFGGHQGREEPVQAAMSAVKALQGEEDLLVESFFLEPFDAGVNEAERRRTLLSRRTDLLKMGATDEELIDEAPEFHLSRIRHPQPPAPQDLDWRGIWRLSSSSVIRSSVSDLRTGCETTLKAATTMLLLRKPSDTCFQEEQIVATTHAELKMAGVQTGGPSPWGSVSMEHVVAPEHTFLEAWVKEAAQHSVVVLLILPGHPIAQGPLQQLLESNQVPYTGVSSLGADLCSNRAELLRTLRETVSYGGPPTLVPEFHTVSAPELMARCETESSAQDFFNQLFGTWEDKKLVIRPSQASNGIGVVRIGSGEDLRVYAAAIQQWSDEIPADMLSAESENVSMLVPPPQQLIIEPLLVAEPLQINLSKNVSLHGALQQGADAPVVLSSSLSSCQYDWPNNNSWLEVRACMIGSPGETFCLGLTTRANITATKNDGTVDVVLHGVDITPPPPSVVDPSIVENAIRCLPIIVECAACGGGATMVTALLNVANGDIFVQDIDPNPDLSLDGLVMRQAALTGRSLTLVLRELLRLGMTRGEGGAGTGDVDGDDAKGSSSSLFYGSFDDYGSEQEEFDDEGPKEPPSMTENYWGDPHIRIDEDFIAGGKG